MMTGYAIDEIESHVAPAPGSGRVFGTNPIAIALPGAHNPVVIDLATSRSTAFGVMLAARMGKQLPEGTLVDVNGNPTTNAAAFLDGGALLPIEGYKGAALSLAVCLLGALGTAQLSETTVGGTTLLAIDVAALTSLDRFAADVERVSDVLLQARGRAAVPFRVPGTRSRQAREHAHKHGLNVADDILSLLINRAADLGVEIP
jgi:delta1-piperideine-2-carboxylate reductase